MPKKLKKVKSKKMTKAVEKVEVKANTENRFDAKVPITDQLWKWLGIKK